MKMKKKTITICGSMKFTKEMVDIEKKVKIFGYKVLMPIDLKIDYWGDTSLSHKTRTEAKKEKDLIREHFRKIDKSDAILVVNLTKGKIKHYIGANTFLELGYAHYINRKIILLNKLPNQKYIRDELMALNIASLNGKLENIKKYL
jgi:hypothetical protein